MALIYAFAIFRRNQIFGTMRKRNSGINENYCVLWTVAGYSLMVMVERLQLVYYWAFRRIGNRLAMRGIHQKDVWLWMDTQKEL